MISKLDKNIVRNQEGGKYFFTALYAVIKGDSNIKHDQRFQICVDARSISRA